MGFLPWQSHFTFVTFKQLIFTCFTLNCHLSAKICSRHSSPSHLNPKFCKVSFLHTYQCAFVTLPKRPVCPCSMHRQFLPHQVQFISIPNFDNWPLRFSVPLWCDTRKKWESFASQWHGRILQLFFWKWQPLTVKRMPNSDSTNPNTQCWTLMTAQSARVAGFIRPAKLWV